MQGPFSDQSIFLNRKVLQLINETNCKTLLDIGPGIRPFSLINFPTHICIEPHYEYVNILREQRYEVFQETALDYLSKSCNFDLILLSDVIEHMEKNVGKKVLELAISAAKKQLIIFTPLGFVKNTFLFQKKDAWGLNGIKWQKHRSGWLPNDFPNFEIIIDEKYEKDHGMFAAILTK